MSSLLSSSKIYNGFQEKDPSTILKRMYNDILNKKGKFKNVIDKIDAQRALLQCVIDITGQSDHSDIQVEMLLTDPGPDEPSTKVSEGASVGGKHTKRTKQKE